MRILVCLALLVGALALLGCPDERAPVPTIHVTVLSEPGTYLLDGERVYLTELRSELQRLADKYRRPTTPDARAHVVVNFSSRIPYHRVQEALGMCSSLGFDTVEAQVRDEPSDVR